MSTFNKLKSCHCIWFCTLLLHIFRHSCLPVFIWRRVVLYIFDPKQLLRVSCILWCFNSKCFSIILKNASLCCLIIIQILNDWTQKRILKRSYFQFRNKTEMPFEKIVSNRRNSGYLKKEISWNTHSIIRIYSIFWILKNYNNSFTKRQHHKLAFWSMVENPFER